MWTDPWERCHALVAQGRTDEAARVAYDSAFIAESELGSHSEAAARAMRTLGEVLLDSGRPNEAIPPLSRAFHVFTRNLRSTADAAATLDLLGTAYEKAGKIRRARRAFEKELDMRERAYGEADPSLATPLEHLASIEAHRHHDGEAEEFLRRALAVLEEEGGPQQIEALTRDMHALGALYLREAKFFDARRVFERAVRLLVGLHGPEHRDVALPLRDLAAAYARSGELATAEALLRRSLAILQKSHAEELVAVRRQLSDVETARACEEADARS